MTSSIAAPPQIHTIVTTTTATNGEEPLKIILKKYPILVNKNDQKPFHYEYGTAGFRYHYTKLPPIMIRMAILATLRSLALSKSSKNGFGVGIMITASHNPEQDNGMKISDYNGGMLHPNWEQMATILANKSNQEILSWLQGRNEKQHNNHQQQQQQQQQPIGEKKNAIIHVGRDTRSHSYALSQIVIQTILALANCIPQQHQPTTITIIDHGCITTPQLHYYVLRSNLHVVPNALLSMSSAIGYQHDYLHGIVSSYLTLISTDDNNYDDNNDHGKRTKESVMLVDCACGIGGLKIPMFNELLQRCQMEKGIVTPSSSINHNKLLQLIPFNLPHDGPLNHECGAEYVQKQQKFPTIYTKDFFNPGSIDDDKTTMEYVASLDGDADRIVFHYKDSKGKLVLLDGDKIAALVSSFLQQEVDHLARVVQEAKSIRCGVVQTAYANGASTNYLKNMVKTNVIIAKTGVKYVHTAAHENYDVGTYFEANGHGTVLFGSKFYQLLAKAELILLHDVNHNSNNNANSQYYHRATVAWQRLRVLPRLINQAVGDALSDLFLVDAILYLKGWTLQDWNKLYKDLPSRQCKVKVKDRSLVHTNDNETEAIKPPLLQPALDNAMISFSSSSALETARAFVRPSGTENVVRVYAEATTQKNADALASEAAAIVYRLCKGTGEVPNFTNHSNL